MLSPINALPMGRHRVSILLGFIASRTQTSFRTGRECNPQRVEHCRCSSSRVFALRYHNVDDASGGVIVAPIGEL
jgi:hypothetical protein